MSLIHPATNFAKYFKMKSPCIATFIPSKDAVEKVKRDLFGPVDRESAKQFADKEIAKHQNDAAIRWNFDFIHGHPIITHHNQFVWERVVPSPVSLTSSSSSSSSSSSTSTSTATISTPSTSRIQTTATIAINTNLNNNNQNTATAINYDNHSQHLKNLNHLLEKQRLKQQQQQQRQQQQQQQNSVHLNLTELDVKCSKYRLRTAAGKRQPKITEYLKERKSISPKSKKILRPRRITIAGALSNN